jgi:hypothetical protein
MDLFHRLNLLDHEWIELELAVSLLDGILVGAKNVHDLIAVNQNEFSFIDQEFWQLLAIGLQFSFQRHNHAPNTSLTAGGMQQRRVWTTG